MADRQCRRYRTKGLCGKIGNRSSYIYCPGLNPWTIYNKPSTESLLRPLCEIARNSRTFATITLWPRSCIRLEVVLCFRI